VWRRHRAPLTWLLVKLPCHRGERRGDVGAWSAELAACRGSATRTRSCRPASTALQLVKVLGKVNGCRCRRLVRSLQVLLARGEAPIQPRRIHKITSRNQEPIKLSQSGNVRSGKQGLNAYQPCTNNLIFSEGTSSARVCT
jgi:hypothetical protein